MITRGHPGHPLPIGVFVMLPMTLTLKITAKNGCPGCPRLSGDAASLLNVPVARPLQGGRSAFRSPPLQPRSKAKAERPGIPVCPSDCLRAVDRHEAWVYTEN